MTFAASKCDDPSYVRDVEELQQELARQGLTRKQSVQRRREEACKATAVAVEKKQKSRTGGFSKADREEVAARSNPIFLQTAMGTVNLDGHGKVETGFKLTRHWLAMELEWGVEDIWNPNNPTEVKSKFKFDDLVQMPKVFIARWLLVRPLLLAWHLVRPRLLVWPHRTKTRPPW